MAVSWKTGALRHEAALQSNRKVGLYGGSFNPAHAGHKHVATEALKHLGLDEVWLLVSPGNPLKAQSGMAPFTNRIKSAQTIIGQHPRIRVRSIETTLNTRYTADTITALQYEMPTTHFVWVMGADNLAGFDQWKNWETIAKSLPIAVFDRTGYTLKGFRSRLVQQYARFRVTSKRLIKSQTPAWTFVATPRHPGSATHIRSQASDNWYADKNGKEA